MNDDLAKRVRAAAGAAWCTVLIGAIWLTAAWGIILWLLSARPGWLLTLWGGGDLTWETVHNIVMYFISAAKLILFVVVLLSIFLSFWSRKLSRLG